MIGFLRLALALLVMAHHLVPQAYPWGRVAVLGFYILAGYFGALSLATRRQTPIAFWRGRVLRIYPTYLFALLISLPAKVPSGPWNWGQNLLLFPAHYSQLSVSAAWVLWPMLLMWGVMPFVQTRLLAWVGLSVAGLTGRVLLDGWMAGYLSLWCPSLCFALGAVAWHRGVRVPPDRGLAACAAAISFPLFLVHYPVSSSIPLAPGWPLFLAALPPTLALSWLLVVAVEQPIARYRQSLRNP